VPVGAIAVEGDVLVYERDDAVKMEALDNHVREGDLFAANAKEKKKELDRMVEMVEEGNRKADCDAITRSRRTGFRDSGASS
jgi:hypothetical protein